jgi:hypothetical protein
LHIWSNFDGLGWLLLTLGALLFLQRFLHREIQAVLLIATRHPALTMVLFSLLFFPGILLHEFSHFLAAVLLGVQTGRFSLIPQAMPDGRLRLGYVETARAGPVRDALIGAAPLAAGMLVVAYISIEQLHLATLWDFLRNGQIQLFWLGLVSLPRMGDFWLWFYLVFTVSSTMLPSASDRQAWLPVGLVLAGLLLLAVLAGAGPWMLAHLAPPLNNFLRSAALLFGLSALVHGLLAPLFALLHKLLARLTHVDIQ